MTVPLDRLYNYISDLAREICNEDVIIYRFFPHGSKKLSDLAQLKPYDWFSGSTKPGLICHDQEPLDYDSIGLFNRKNGVEWLHTIYDRSVLLHSEQRSKEIEKYVATNSHVPVYYWSHGIIARDWFRYAEHVQQRKQVNQTFLIYNRAWSGTREYRLKFTEHLIRLGLTDQCRTSVNPIEPELGIHYEIHKFKNPQWRPKTVLENFFPISTAHSHYSADFDIEDYEATDIEVVLETLFDDNRLHLTEKSLRPIACGQPFILAGTPGSLEYLRSYGFKTFAQVWDESYDECIYPEERLKRITDLMRQIANWGPGIQERQLAKARKIAEYNRKYFFSQEFFNQLTEELKNNLRKALTLIETTNTSSNWISNYTVEHLEQVLEQQKKLPGFTKKSHFYKSWTKENIINVDQLAKKYNMRSLKPSN
jgi:hypothetical protein